MASRRRGLLVSSTQLLGVLRFHLFLLEVGQWGQTDEWRSDEVGLLLPLKPVRTCGRRSSLSRSGFLDRGGDRIGRMNRMRPNRRDREPVRKTVPFGPSRRRRRSGYGVRSDPGSTACVWPTLEELKNLSEASHALRVRIQSRRLFPGCALRTTRGYPLPSLRDARFSPEASHPFPAPLTPEAFQPVAPGAKRPGERSDPGTRAPLRIPTPEGLQAPRQSGQRRENPVAIRPTRRRLPPPYAPDTLTPQT